MSFFGRWRWLLYGLTLLYLVSMVIWPLGISLLTWEWNHLLDTWERWQTFNAAMIAFLTASLAFAREEIKDRAAMKSRFGELLEKAETISKNMQDYIYKYSETDGSLKAEEEDERKSSEKTILEKVSHLKNQMLPLVAAVEQCTLEAHLERWTLDTVHSFLRRAPIEHIWPTPLSLVIGALKEASRTGKLSVAHLPVVRPSNRRLDKPKFP